MKRKENCEENCEHEASIGFVFGKQLSTHIWVTCSSSRLSLLVLALFFPILNCSFYFQNDYKCKQSRKGKKKKLKRNDKNNSC